MGKRHFDSDHTGLFPRKCCGFCIAVGRKRRPNMNHQLPHKHKCKSCGVLIVKDCECDDKRVFILFCVECEDEEENGELQF